MLKMDKRQLWRSLMISWTLTAGGGGVGW